MTKIEITAKEHLEQMVDITRTLSYNDIRLLNRNGKKKKEEETKIDFEHKERE